MQADKSVMVGGWYAGQAGMQADGVSWLEGGMQGDLRRVGDLQE